MAQWWERSPLSNAAWVRFLDPAPYLGCVSCWFSSSLRRFCPVHKKKTTYSNSKTISNQLRNSRTAEPLQIALFHYYSINLTYKTICRFPNWFRGVCSKTEILIHWEFPFVPSDDHASSSYSSVHGTHRTCQQETVTLSPPSLEIIVTSRARSYGHQHSWTRKTDSCRGCCRQHAEPWGWW